MSHFLGYLSLYKMQTNWAYKRVIFARVARGRFVYTLIINNCNNAIYFKGMHLNWCHTAGNANILKQIRFWINNKIKILNNNDGKKK